jgi:hypothetical protein
MNERGDNTLPNLLGQNLFYYGLASFFSISASTALFRTVAAAFFLLFLFLLEDRKNQSARPIKTRSTFGRRRVRSTTGFPHDSIVYGWSHDSIVGDEE